MTNLYPGGPGFGVYNPNVQRPILHPLADIYGNLEAHDRYDVMASYLNFAMYMPRPVSLKPLEKGDYYYLVIYSESGPNRGQAFILGDHEWKSSTNVTTDSFLFWDTFVHTDMTKRFNADEQVSEKLFVDDQLGAEFLIQKLEQQAENEARKLNRFEVEQVYQQYIRDGNEKEALEYVLKSGFGPVSNFKGTRPSAAATGDPFGNY